MFGFQIPSIWMAVAGAALFGFVVWKAFDYGYDYANADCETKIASIKLQIQQEYEKEMQRLRDANDAAAEQQEQLAEELKVKESILDDLLLKLEEEARNDPEAGSCGISEGSAKRLNQIQ